MKRRENSFNPKRRLLPAADLPSRAPSLASLADKVRYGGNPEHKRNPGDFDLTPPAAPRPGKSLCDLAGITKREDALKLLKSGFLAGLVSDRFVGEWPKNVWMVTDDGLPLEAQLEVAGKYHGYPMPEEDPFADEVCDRWKEVTDG